MDITPIYDLRDRLRTAMIAGTDLLAEDFGLKRAVEALAPLEKASPVFAKIGELCKNLLASEQQDKESALLDTITLVDAVCCTQGHVDVPGEIQPVIKTTETCTVLSNMPYSVLNPLQDALTNSGSGRYSFVIDCHNDRPELFHDYRIRVAMVQALNATYAELADQVCCWLMEDGKDVVPLLMRDFNPKGKKDMVRRLRVIEWNYGAKANDFYIKQLEEAEGELRQNLIYALRHSEENIELLRTLTKQERGNTKKAAYYALAFLGNEEVKDFFTSLYEKKPIDIMNFLYLSKSPWASKLVADCVHTYLTMTPAVTGDKVKDEAAANKLVEQQRSVLDALIGKTGDDIYEAIHFAAERINKSSGLYGKMVMVLCYSLIMNPDDNLIQLAVSLYENIENNAARTHYFQVAVLAKLIETGKNNDASSFIDWLDINLSNNPTAHQYLHYALEYMKLDESSGTYYLSAQIANYFFDASYKTPPYTLPIQCDFSGRFLDLLMRCNYPMIDDKIEWLINPADKVQCAKLEEYFYKKSLSVNNSRRYLGALRKCGCTRCEGLLVQYATTSKTMSMWDLLYFISYMPGSKEAKFAEASRIPELVEQGKVKIQSWKKETYLKRIEGYI